MTSSDNKELISNFSWWMKSSSTWSNSILRNWYFNPVHCQEVEYPKIVHIAYSLSSIHYEIGIEQFRCVISSCPRSGFIGFGSNLYPFFGLPVEYINGIESLFVGSSSSEHHQLIIFFIIMHCAVGPVTRVITSSGDFCPFHGNRVERPDIIHVDGIWIDQWLPAYPPKKTTSSSRVVQVCPQRKLGKWPVLSLCLTGRQDSFSIFIILEFYKCSIRLYKSTELISILNKVDKTSTKSLKKR